MYKPSNYDGAEAKQFTGFNSPSPGAYIFIIAGAFEIMSKSQSPMLVLDLDIAHGEFKGHYEQMSEDLKKNCYLKHRRLLTEEQSEYLKGDIKAIEESNNGFHFNFDESKLSGKYVGGMLREEEYMNNNGEIKTTIKLAYLCSIDKVKKNLLKPMPIKKLASGQQHATVLGNQDDNLPF